MPRQLWIFAGALVAATPFGVAVAQTEQAKVAIDPHPRWPFRTGTAKAPTGGQGGIGLVLEARPDGVYAQSVVPGGPAQRAGVLGGDHIARVDQWVAPPAVKVSDIAEHIRGPIGTTAELGLKRAGADVVVQVTRASMDRLFPGVSKDLMFAKAGCALLATGALHSLGIRFDNDARAGQLLRYTWSLAPASGPAGAVGGMTGTGVVQFDAKDGATIQVSDWRLELRGQPDGAGYVAQSNLAVHEVVGDWLALAPPWPSLVKPRASLAKKAARWQGPAKLRLQLLADGKPVTNQRATLKLVDTAAQSLDTATQRTDAQGRVEFAVPKGEYRVQQLVTSVSGAGCDTFYSHDLVDPPQVALQPDSAQPLAVTLKTKVAPPATNLDWTTDPRVGQGLPQIDVQRWYHLDKAPPSLAGKVLLIDVWATWCGPCKATAPVVAELHARLASKGLVTVALSVDKDESAIEDYAKDMLPGSVPIGWAGPEAMDLLETESIPTFFVVDGQGRIRGVHKGTGWSLQALQAFLETLLAEGVAKKK